MCSITEQLKSELRNAGAAAFPRIAEETGVALSFIRKFYYGGRENPRVQTIQPLITYFGGRCAAKPQTPKQKETVNA
ncbi:hypothetical protein ACCQ08_25025 [Comamonas sp. SY3]|uniref:hypothetical protein n=1 Tax=Comamonas sp. SY3 TaxID=3243601 RepID=UPI00359339D3